VLPRPLQLPSDAALKLIAASALIGLLAVAIAALPLRRDPSAQEEERHAAASRPLEVQAAQRSA
jgi:hypothetical protein